MNTRTKRKHTMESLHFVDYISNDFDLSTTCRVCMAQCIELYSLSAIPPCTKNAKGCIEKIHYCTNVKILEDDSLPHTICQACINLLEKAYEFKIICENSDQKLRKIVRNTSSLNLNDDTKNKQVLDVLCYSDSGDKNELVDSFTYKSTDTVSERPVPQLEVSGINKLSEKLNQEQMFIKNDIVGSTKTRDVKKKSKLTNCSRAKKNHTRVSPATEDFDNTANEMFEPELEILEIKQGVRRMRELKCRGCTETFADKKTRDEHQRTHSDRSFICDICGKGFLCHTTCYTHRKSHFPPKFFCEECPYKTCHKNDLIKHNRIHTGVKLYQCEYCCRSFTFNSNLVKHVKRHRGDRRFKCNLCPKAYFEKVSLSDHLDWHKGVKRHECRICGMAYVDRQHWVRHMAKMHEVQVPPTKPGRRKTNIQVADESVP